MNEFNKDIVKSAIVLREADEWCKNYGQKVKIVNLRISKKRREAIYDLIRIDEVRGYAERHNNIKTDLR